MNYLIQYTVKSDGGQAIKSGVMRVKNKKTEFEAKCSLENYLKKKHNNFGSLTIHECIDDIIGSIFNDFNGVFGK